MAAASAPAQVIGVSPAVQSVTAEPNQESLTYSITITNNSAQAATVTLSAANFTTLGTGNTIRFLPANKTTKHGLASSLVLPPLVLLQAHESRMVTLTLTGLQQLAAGGHYTAVLVQSMPGASSGSKLTLKQSVASLIFLTTNGKGTYGLHLQVLPPSVAWHQTPSQLNLLFKNTGNVQATPRGYIIVNGPFNHLIGKAVLNPNSSLVLPGTSRLLQTTLPTGHPLLPGRYSARVYYRFDGVTKYQQINTNFYYIGWFSELVVILVLIVAIWRFLLYKNVFKKS